jgi:creatinine amidohydrolase/Fe(II)-dependent formamide hydrolase-like protein
VPLSYWSAAAQEAGRIFKIDGGFIGHAGQAETSLSLALRNELVGPAGNEFESITEPPLLPTSDRLGSSGVIGHPDAASAELGREFFQLVVEGLAAFFDRFVPEESTLRSK